MEILIYISLGALAALIGMILYTDDFKPPVRPATSFNNNPEKRTEELIGHDAYVKMIERVDKLIADHKEDGCTIINITSGSNDRDAMHELHHLLPGEPLEMSKYLEDGMECIGVYSRGMRVGSLMLKDAADYLETARNHDVTGIYVARQDCYEDYSHLDLGIIVYFRTVPTSGCKMIFSDLKAHMTGLHHSQDSPGINFFQN